MRTRALALASDASVEEVARTELARSKSAVAAVTAGFFHAAGREPGVLLGPLTLLVAGVGLGGRAFDGRLRQPGLGAKRPRGLLPGDPVPVAVRAALPTGVAALSVALAYDGTSTMTRLARAGARAAADAGARARAALLERVSQVGPGALAEARFVHPLLHAASPSQGGMLTPQDFAPAADVSAEAVVRRSKRGSVLEPSWARSGAAPEQLGAGHALCAVDARGVFAALVYRDVGDGLEIDELELRVALAARPVRRGEPRLRPGERLPCSAPAEILCDAALAPIEVRVLKEPKARRGYSIVRTGGRWIEART